jgi:MarR family transcriptional regulator, organic hydroperoxide resistance regulator
MKDKAAVIQEILGLRYRASRIVGGYAFKHWQQLDVPIAQLKSLFIILAREKVNYRTLAMDLGVTPGNVTGIIDRLVEQGLVNRKPDSEDRRIIWLEASEKGCELFSNLMETEARHTVRILEYMNRDDLIAFAKGLVGFINAVEKYQKESIDIASDKE